ncbi:MAG: SGNH/GDSL hydrolase family protein [Planctomycetota bacterium]
MASPRALRRVILAVLAAASGGALAWLALTRLREPETGRITKDPVDSAEQPELTWNDKEALVVDPVAGFRPRRSFTWEHPMAALDGKDGGMIVKRRDRHGFLRETDLPDLADRPRVLVLGDSHVDGVVSTADNFTSILERRFESDARPIHVLNAGCGLYSLWQYALRARTLVPQYRPRVVVVGVFLGNDLLDLENRKVPHLDDDLREQPAAAEAAAETTSERSRALAIERQFEQIFWQGLNQALYLHRQPDRLQPILAKARRSVEDLERTAAANGAALLWVLIPSFDLVQPKHASGLSKLAGEVVDGGVQRKLRDGFMALLADRSADVIDLEPVFVADGRLELYALDFHIYREGHRLLALQVEPRLKVLLSR